MTLRRIPRRQWLVWGPLLALLTGLGLERAGVVRFGSPPPHRGHLHAPGEVRLLPVSIEQIAAVEIVRDGNRYLFQRDWGGAPFKLAGGKSNHTDDGHAHGKGESHGHSHDGHGANEDHHHHGDGGHAERAAAIQHHLAALGRARIKRRFAPSSERGDYGLDRSHLTVRIYHSPFRPPIASFTVGGPAPDTLSRYVSIEGQEELVTIAQYQVDNLHALLDVVAEALHVH